MRVNANRLDLGSLRSGERCTITTGSASIRMIHGGSSIDMGIYLNGVGMAPLSDSGLMIREGGVHWLCLTRLAPRRLYTVIATDGGAGGQISDDTPHQPEPGETRSGGPSWGLLGKLLGGGR